MGGSRHPRAGKSWRAVALAAWGTDILQERSYVWLVASRLFFLMAESARATRVLLSAASPSASTGPAADLAVLARSASSSSGLLAIVPAGRMSDRVGRKR